MIANPNNPRREAFRVRLARREMIQRHDAREARAIAAEDRMTAPFPGALAYDAHTDELRGAA